MEAHREKVGGNIQQPVTSQQRPIQQQVISSLMVSQADSINQLKSRLSDTENLPNDAELLRWISCEVNLTVFCVSSVVESFIFRKILMNQRPDYAEHLHGGRRKE